MPLGLGGSRTEGSVGKSQRAFKAQSALEGRDSPFVTSLLECSGFRI